MKYRALVDMSLRKSPDPKAPEYEDWFDWPAGTVFEPPEHMNVERALARGICEKAGRTAVVSAPAVAAFLEEVTDA